MKASRAMAAAGASRRGRRRGALAASSALALLALVAMAGSAPAHVETFSEAKPLTVGPYNALVEPRPSPMYANSALSMTAIFSNAETGSYVTRVPATLELEGPDGFQAREPMEPDGTGYMVASVVIQDAGEYVARILVEEDGVTHQNETEFTVYPDLPVRVRPGDPSQPDPLARETYPLTVEVVDAETLLPSDALDDLTVRIEHWTDDHRTMLGFEEHAMEEVAPGRWRLDHVFSEKGMYHLRFSSASGGFETEDVPLLHLYALEAQEPTGKESPTPAMLAPLALALLALLARRR